MSGAQPFIIPPAGKTPGRNDPCPCGSGRKYKHCCAAGSKSETPAPVVFGPLSDAGRLAGAPEAPVIETKRQGEAATRQDAPRMRRQPPSPAAARLHREAIRLVEADRAGEAIQRFQEAARLDPANPYILVDMAAALLLCDRVDDATRSLAHALWLDDSIARTHYMLGRALSWKADVTKADVTGAIKAYRAAVGLAPKLGDAHFHLADLLRSRGLYGQAAEAYDRCVASTPNTTMGRMAAASVLVMRGRAEEAIALLRRARALEPKSIEVIRLLANTLADTGRFDEAEEQLLQALALGPKDAFEYYKLTNLRRFTSRDRALMQRMDSLFQVFGLREHDRMLLHFALGKAHGDLGEFEAAMGHYNAANRVRGGMAPLHRAETGRKIDHYIELFPPDGTGFNAAEGVNDERPVFIVGLPRSGTTLVEQILSSHPAVTAGGELGFWGEEGAAAMGLEATRPFTREPLHGLAAGYQAVLRDISPDALRVTDKNPFNFYYLGLLRLVFPRAHIIHCRRHPVDNCLSMYTNYFDSLELLFLGNAEDLVFYHGEYSRLMDHWRRVLPPERFLEIDYETLVADPEGETRRLIAFCGLEWDDACLRPERNKRAVTTASAWQVRQPVYRSSVQRWRNYQPWLGPLAKLLPEEEQAGAVG